MSDQAPTRPNQAVRHAVSVLHAFSVAEPSLGVNEIARRVGLNRSSVSRLLQTLAEARLLEASESSVTIPYYERATDYQRSSGKLLPLPIARQAIGALRKVYDAGYALIDASIDNILVDRTEGLKLIDFEFAHRYEHQPATFEAAFDIAGPPPDFQGDQPIQGGNSYDRNWRPYVGLSLHSLLHDPTWLQHVKRTAYYALHAHRFVPRLLRHYVRQALGTSHPAHLGSRVPGGASTALKGTHAEQQRERRAA